MNQTPEEELDELNEDIAKIISDQLDEIADKYLQQIKELSLNIDGGPKVDKLLLIRDILIKEYHFRGNSENYCDYRNSLLNHVFDTRKGIPITLCILFACIYRRLKLQTFLVGLPVHVVLGFQTGMDNDEADTHDLTKLSI